MMNYNKRTEITLKYKPTSLIVVKKFFKYVIRHLYITKVVIKVIISNKNLSVLQLCITKYISLKK